LSETVKPEDYLRSEYFRAGRGGGGQMDANQWAFALKWIDDRDDLVFGRVRNADGTVANLHRIAITTDAGIGKSAATKWMEYRMNQPDTGLFAFRIEISELCKHLNPTSFSSDLLNLIAARWNDRIGSRLDEESAKLHLQALRDRSRLVLILDGLDQMAGDPNALGWLLESPAWQTCRFVVAGRVQSLRRYWDALFKDRPWRYLQVEEFDEEQQREYLGAARYDSIPEDARTILSVPRVLEYLLGYLVDLENSEGDSRKSSAIKSAADVFYGAIERMIHGGMKESARARLIGWSKPIAPDKVQDSGVRTAFELLSCIAFESPQPCRQGTKNTRPLVE